MQVAQLIERLRRLPPDAFVVIADEVVSDVELRAGKVTIGYLNPVFVTSSAGRDQAVVFTAKTELSDGSVVSMAR